MEGLSYGVISRKQLLSLGVPPGEIRGLLTSGTLHRIRRGWYRTSAAHPQVVRAVRAGGALSCVSALELHGAWVPRHWPDGRLHVRRSRHFERNGLPPGVRSCPLYPHAGATVTRPVDTVPIALACALTCRPPDQAVVLIDSALNKGLVSPTRLAAVMATLPQSARLQFDRIDPTAQSGTETLVRLRLRARHIKLESQVTIPGVGRVDFLVGDRLVVEVDSWTYHADPDQFARDRDRDRRLVALGYIVIRLTFDDVMSGWERVERDILAVVRAKQHLWPRVRRG